MKHLVVLTGTTAIGKTDLSILLAQHFNTEIISADSRQTYRELAIGTAVPTASQLAAVVHHQIQHISVADYYNVSMYEQEVLTILERLFSTKDVVFLVGGSGMYLDVVCQGIDDLPTVDPELRQQLMQRWQEQGIEQLRKELKLLDPVFYDQVDLGNAKRILKALEVSYQTGIPYSQFRTGEKRERPFRIHKIALERPREEIYQRIDQRVLLMIDEGLEQEARSVLPYRHLNSLNTVGYKELFAYFDGEYKLDRAIELIQRDTRRFAKRQMSWFRRDTEYQWFHPEQTAEIRAYIASKIVE
jgi:tRNA dimethylallyltransferase